MSESEKKLSRSRAGKNLRVDPSQKVEWIQCSNPSCGKWRPLPPYMKSSAILESCNKWYCVLNSWDEAVASCGAPQETGYMPAKWYFDSTTIDIIHASDSACFAHMKFYSCPWHSTASRFSSGTWDSRIQFCLFLLQWKRYLFLSSQGQLIMVEMHQMTALSLALAAFDW